MEPRFWTEAWQDRFNQPNGIPQLDENGRFDLTRIPARSPYPFGDYEPTLKWLTTNTAAETWSVSSNATAETTISQIADSNVPGGQVTRIEIDNGGGGESLDTYLFCALPNAVDVAGQVKFKIKMDDPTALTHFYLELSEEAGTGKYDERQRVSLGSINDDPPAADHLEANTWRTYSLHPESFTAEGGGAAWYGTSLAYSTVRVIIRAIVKAGDTIDFRIGPIAYEEPPAQGAFVVQFDDIFDTQYTRAWPILKARGIPGMCWVIPSAIGTEEHMTLSQLLALQADGWLMGVHEHTTIADQTASELRALQAGAQAQMTQLHLNSGTQYQLWRGNSALTNYSAENVLRERYVAARGVSSGTFTGDVPDYDGVQRDYQSTPPAQPSPWIPFSWYQLPHQSTDDLAAYAGSTLETLIANTAIHRGVATLYAHRIGATEAAGTTKEQTFVDAIDACLAAGLEPITLHDWLLRTKFRPVVRFDEAGWMVDIDGAYVV